MEVYFIVHGNAKTGMGHIIRSLSLATAFQEQGHGVTFFSKYGQGIRMIQKAGIKVHALPFDPHQDDTRGFFYGDPKELGKDIAHISKKITEKADVIIVDSYNISIEFFRGLRPLTKCLVYIDDLDLFPYPVDILVNGTASALDMGYEKRQSAELLLGTGYNQVRKDFCSQRPRQIKRDVGDVLITTGSADPYHMTERILDILMGQKEPMQLRYHVIVGGGFEKDIWSDPSITDHKNIFLYDRPENLSDIMLKCDLAIAAGGSTLYELSASGIPAIVFAYADNQLLHIKALERYGILKYIGYHDKINEMRLLDHLMYLMTHADIRDGIVKRAQSLVDGNGCKRIVEKVEQKVLRYEGSYIYAVEEGLQKG